MQRKGNVYLDLLMSVSQSKEVLRNYVFSFLSNIFEIQMNLAFEAHYLRKKLYSRSTVK